MKRVLSKIMSRTGLAYFGFGMIQLVSTIIYIFFFIAGLIAAVWMPQPGAAVFIICVLLVIPFSFIWAAMRLYRQEKIRKATIVALIPLAFGCCILVLPIIHQHNINKITDDMPIVGRSPDNPWAMLTAIHPITVTTEMPHGFVGLPSIDTVPFYARFNDHMYFKIPRNYLLELSNIKYGHSDPSVHFRIGMLYPTFSGATPETIDQFDFRGWKKSPNMILVSGPYEDAGHANKTNFAAEDVPDQQMTKDGLLRVTHAGIGKVTDAYFIVDDGQPSLIRCDKVPNSPGPLDNPLCQGEINITDDYVIWYQFRRELFPEWKTIHHHVCDFIISTFSTQH